jgi:BolA protein
LRFTPIWWFPAALTRPAAAATFAASLLAAIFRRSEMGDVADRIRRKLTESLAPTRLDLHDESARHAGHAGARAGGETHFRAEIVSAAFVGESRVARQRRVYAILAEELRDQVHALSLTTLTPEEELG